MQCTKLKTYMETGRVVFLPPSRIVPNPAQPRTVFSPESLRELADSIRIHGILQPLSVRKGETHYELIAGERRYRAAQLAGLRELPCIVMRMDDEESALTALMENLQRQDLNFVEEAKAYSTLMTQFSLSQEQVAKAVGKSQSAVCNSLRLLRHSEAVLQKLLEHNLTQRHGRALLKLPTEPQKLIALSHIARNNLSVAQTEQYIDSLLKPQSLPLMREVAAQRADGGREKGHLSPSHGDRVTAHLRVGPVGGSDSPPDCHSLPPTALRLPSSEGALETQKFLATIRQLIRQSPLPITLSQEEAPDHLTITITLPK